MIKLILIGNPISTQSLYGLSCRGKFATRYMTAKGKALKEDYQWQIKSQYKGKLLTGGIDLKVDLYFGTLRKQDIDNFNKILFDAFTGIVWEDDSQIQRVEITKNYDKSNPRIELFII